MQLYNTLVTSTMLETFSQQNFKQTERTINPSFGFWFLGIMLFVVVDQISKVIAEKKLPIFYNENFAFSIPLPTVLMYLLYGLVLGVVMWYLARSWKNIQSLERMSWGLILAGGISNIAERIVRGNVRDFIPVLNGILNVADLYIIFGLVILLMLSRKK